jgi:WD40 repeat protein
LTEDTTPHDYPIDSIQYLPHWDVLVVFERGSRRFKLYNPTEMQLLRTVRGHRGALLRAEPIPEHNLLLTSAEDRTICFWDFNAGTHTHTQPHTQPTSHQTHTALYLYFYIQLTSPLCTVLCCAVLCCVVLCCAVLRCAVLRCAVLCCGGGWWMVVLAGMDGSESALRPQPVRLTVSWRFAKAQTALCWTGHTLFTGDTMGLVTGWNVERAEQKHQLKYVLCAAVLCCAVLCWWLRLMAWSWYACMYE